MRVLSVLCLLPLLNLFPGEVYTDPKTGVRLLHDTIELPVAGEWSISDESLFQNGLGYGYMKAPDALTERAFGERTQALQERRQLLERKRLFWRIRSALGYDYKATDLRSPSDIGQFDWQDHHDAKAAVQNGIIAVLPDVPLIDTKENRAILMVELKPQLNDGKHFLYDNLGNTERVEVDNQRMAEFGLSIIPPAVTVEKDSVMYTLAVRLLEPDQQEVSFTLLNEITGEEKNISVQVTGQSDAPEVFKEWAEYRAYEWGSTHSRLAAMWDARVSDLYGLESFASGFRQNTRNRQTSLLGVLGGDAAIRETLQLQNLTPDSSSEDKLLIPLEDIKAVTVKAHDYEELLGEDEGGNLPLADYCPMDRLFAWFPNPEGILQLLDGSGNVLGRFSSSRSDVLLDHQILEKHLAKLGLTEPQLRLILQSGFVGESAVLLPDLFLREGTDVTTLIRIKNMEAMNPLLVGMGLRTGPGIHGFPTPSGGEAFVSFKADMLMFSTAASELETLKAVMEGHEPSLGQSAEFRYMLTQNRPTPETAAYVYLSDPFIRRLTGPGVKIAQMRRLQAKVQLEQLAAGELMYRMDHRKASPELRTLVDLGYAPDPERLEITAWKDGRAEDATWGRADHLSSITDRIPVTVTEAEKKAYDQYRDQYERFWRQFFDPIAVRVDLKPQREVETTVFILPLINSSIYDTVRGFLSNQSGAPPLQRPVITPPPIAVMSLSLSEDIWIDFIQGISYLVEDQFGLNLPIWEQLGPGVHVGLADSSSVITFGSGELMNLFSAGSNLRGNDMLVFPLFGSLLTRPVVVALELQDPDVTRNALRGMATGELNQGGGWADLNVSIVEITGKEKWFVRLGVGDVVYLTLSMEVQEGYLVLSNLPLNYHPQVMGRESLMVRHASLLLQPDAIDETGPGFEASALDVARKQARAGLEVLHIYQLAGFSSLEDAMAASRNLFGYAPVHPSPGTFVWTERGPESSVFGGRWDSRQPPLDQVDSEGLFPATEQVEVSMQLEGEGLRTILRWKGKGSN